MRYSFLLLATLLLSSIIPHPSFGMMSDSEDSFDVKIFQGSLHQYVQKNDWKNVKDHYEKFERLQDAPWKELADLQVPIWKAASTDKERVGAQVFFDSINEPHQNLIRAALQPLAPLLETFTPSDDWRLAYQRTYGNCVETVANIIETHGYLRVPARALSVAVSASYGNPIARLFVLAFLHSLNPQEEAFFRREHSIISSGFTCGKGKESLLAFLTPNTVDFVDLQDRDLDNEDALKRMSDLALPHYYILLGDYHFRRAGRITPQTSKQTIEPLLSYYKKAMDEGDPSGYLSSITLLASAGEINIETLDDTQKWAFLNGCFNQYKRISSAKRKDLKNYMSRLYKNLQEFLNR